MKILQQTGVDTQQGEGMAELWGQQHAGPVPRQAGTGCSPAPLVSLRGSSREMLLMWLQPCRAVQFWFTEPPSRDLNFSTTGPYHFISSGRLVLAMSFASLGKIL